MSKSNVQKAHSEHCWGAGKLDQAEQLWQKWMIQKQKKQSQDAGTLDMLHQEDALSLLQPCLDTFTGVRKNPTGPPVYDCVWVGGRQRNTQ